MSDVAYTSSEAQPTGKFVYVPITTGSIVIFANLPGFKTVNLSPETVAGIYAGSITKWNDPKIVADNTVTDSKTKKKTIAKLPSQRYGKRARRREILRKKKTHIVHNAAKRVQEIRRSLREWFLLFDHYWIRCICDVEPVNER
ncbi:MAG: substrate-binding domain-containing protein, partial [Candidatus Fonsibacter sp.]